jgi:hypothetical protein
MRLVNRTEFRSELCKLCEKIETKFRRRTVEADRMDRWRREGGTLVASMKRASKLISDLDKEIRCLQVERERTRNASNDEGMGKKGEESKTVTSGVISQTPKVEGGKHREQHERPFWCKEESCPFHVVGFETENNLKQHVLHYHTLRDPDDLGNETATVYSETSHFSDPNFERYVAEVADALYSKVASQQPNAQTLRRICRILPGLLKAFALKIGYCAPTSMHWDVMFFIHKYRR